MSRRNQSTSIWTSAAIIDCLRELAADGQSSRQIAAVLQERFKIDVTPNGVVGKCHRLGIKLNFSVEIFSDEVRHIMRQRAKAGDSPQQIANFLGEKGYRYTKKQIVTWCSKNSIRFGRRTPDAYDHKTRRQRLMEKRQAESVMFADYESLPLPSSRPMTLLELRDHNCKWPLGRDANGARLFCGGFKLSGSNPNRPIPYCTHHHQLSVDQERTMSRHGHKQAA